MKNLYKYLTLAVLPLAFTACQDEIANDNSTVQDKDMYTLHCVMNNDPQSRVQIQLGNTIIESEYCYWNNGDQLAVYDHADIDESTTIENPVTNLFTIDSTYDENYPNNAANFIGTSSLTDGHTITAIYPAQNVQDLPIENGWITLSLPSNTEYNLSPTEESLKAYMNKQMFMYATANVNGTNTFLEFHHLTATARITYTNATNTDQSIHEIFLGGHGGNELLFGMKIMFCLETGEFYPITSADASPQTYDTPMTIAAGESYDFYLIFFPGRTFTENDSIFVNVNGTSTPSISTKVISAANGNARYFEAGKRYWFKVAQTEEGLVWTKDMPEKLITNEKLIEILEKNHGYSFIKDENGYVNVYQNYEQINRITSINIWQEDAISTLEGIEYLPNLECIYCNSPELSHLDVSKNLKLKELHCSNGKLSQIDVTKNTELTILWIERNQITELDLTANTELIDLHCGENPLGELNVAANTTLQNLYCQNNNLSKLDVTTNIELQNLYCGDNQLTELNVKSNTKLQELNCVANQLTELNVIANTELRRLNCDENLLTKLNITANTMLQELICEDNRLNELNITANTQLQYLSCGGNQLNELNVTANTQLQYLRCGGNQLSELNVIANNALKELVCGSNQLTKLDVTANTELQELWCSWNQLSELNVMANTALQNLSCGYQETANEKDKTLILTLNEAQQEKWTTSWKNNNWNVVLSNASSSNSGADFAGGGVY